MPEQTSAIDPQALFDANYYAHDCGRPYQRDDVWLAVFKRWADEIARRIGPSSALDAGCAYGLLVETLRARGVPAWGIDISEYAIGQVHASVKAYCRVGSITAPFGQGYDLITCIEVLEHLPQAESERALANLCAHTDDIIFSSSPDDHETESHFNVQPPAYWLALFAQQGFYQDKDFDASFITPWAMRLRRARTLIISHDIVGAAMAGPGIRYLNLAKALAQMAPGMPVTLAIPQHSPAEADALAEGFAIVRYAGAMSAPGEAAGLLALARSNRSVVLPGDVLAACPQLADLDTGLVVDGYNPLLAEWLLTAPTPSPAIPIAGEGWGGGTSDDAMVAWRARMQQITPQILMGDFFMCASERQRDWWLGLLEAHGRVNPLTIGADPTLRNLVDVVPFGLPDTPPQHTRTVIKGVWPGIGPDDKVILWGGGLWPWLDPLTAIRAMAEVSVQHPEARLVFPGTRHPNPQVAGMPTLLPQAQALADELGLRDKVVFFGDWVAYADWANVLLESDVALTLHIDTLEARLAWRTRVLDYLWAGLPTVATRGDATSELIAQYGTGELVVQGDVAGVAGAVLRALSVERGAWSVERGAMLEALSWTRAVGPLVRFCLAPHRAADRASAASDAVGNPFYAAREGAAVQAVAAERDRWRALAEGYARGKVMRVMAWVRERLRSFS